MDNKAIYIGVGIVIVLILVGLASLGYNVPLKAKEKLDVVGAKAGAGLSYEEKAAKYKKAPEWESYAGVIGGPNRDKLSANDLKGKVVLVDFWTYTCINCIRTMPYTEGWYEKYKDMGLVVVGMHSPEFDFEKNRQNVQMAYAKYGLSYPAVLDPDHKIWNQFGNSYWPRHYLIDRDGFIRYDHIGEGGYDETEEAIKAVLEEGSAPMDAAGNASISAEAVNFGRVRTPELYFGGNFRRAPFGSVGFPQADGVAYDAPASIAPNMIYLQGVWQDTGDGMRLISKNGSIILAYDAKAAHLVCSSAASSRAFAYIDGKLHIGPEAQDYGAVEIGESRLYRIADTGAYGKHTLKIDIEGAGFEAYAFTFG